MHPDSERDVEHTRGELEVLEAEIVDLGMLEVEGRARVLELEIHLGLEQDARSDLVQQQWG
jgi:hypothetical protein